ncbi:MAG: RecQ family ATP-dependent DNA helicase [Planctomycetota bacterium]|nr:MAG: RecQ family ATP-dependent DNA helicase [Planctomycetota bacterium]
MSVSQQADSLSNALQQFGLTEFRPGQREVIEAILAGHDCMCIMPTGGGKSLCYQLPSVIRAGLTIVVSPLIALMKDQVDSLQARGIPATLINSTLSAAQQQQRLQEVAAGKYRLVYVAPERLRNPRFVDAIRATPIQLLAIDEAHCISQWGHDFRPDYARIGQFREVLGGVQTIALTATATPRVRDDICDVLRLRKPKQFMSGFARPNLHFGVVQANADREKLEQVGRFLQQQPGAGIIYCATRKRCDTVVEYIAEQLHIPVGAYHAGLLPEQRRAIQDRFMNDDLRIVVATNAFGMGIDKPDLRFVIHFNMPGSLEAYYQEAGRAGRDGLRSTCVMLYAYQDRYIQEFFIDNRYPSRELIQQVYEFLQEIDEDPIEMTMEEIKTALGLSVSAEAIGSCLKILARTRVLERLEAGGGMARVCLDSNLPTLVDLLPREAKTQRTVLRALEQMVGDRRGEEVYVHPDALSRRTQLDRKQIQRALRELNKLEAVDYVPPFRGRATHFRRRDVPFERLGIDFDHLRKMKEVEYERLNQVVGYAQSSLCRQRAILRYFGDTSADNCGQCDRCQRRRGWPQIPAPATAAANPTPGQSGEPGQTGSPSGNDRAVGADQEADQAVVCAGDDPLVLAALEAIVDAVRRTHGRIGKQLIAQFLCGSQNAKVQKMGLTRLAGFGMLSDLRQADAVEALEALLHAGVLTQHEVTRNRPTISVSEEVGQGREVRTALARVPLDRSLAEKLQAIGRRVARPQQAAQQRMGEQARREGQEASPAPAPRDRHRVDPPPQQQRDAAQGETASDFTWTIMLFRQGADWGQVRAIRRMSDDELAASLCDALAAGRALEAKWIACPQDQTPTPGQQRVLRELRRRRAAGLT